MADSGAVRARRARRHKRGDHSECRHDHPGAVAWAPVAGSTGIDAHASLEALAARLEGAHVADPANAAVARELRETLRCLGAAGEAADDELAKFDAAFSAA